jgi:hypothetical protein
LTAYCVKPVCCSIFDCQLSMSTSISWNFVLPRHLSNTWEFESGTVSNSLTETDCRHRNVLIELNTQLACTHILQKDAKAKLTQFSPTDRY